VSDSPSGISETIKMISSLESVIKETVEQEEAIQSQYRLVSARARREHDESLESIDSDYKNSLAEIQSKFHRINSDTEDFYKQRNKWIERAYSHSIERLNKNYEAKKNKSISEIQFKTLTFKRNHEDRISEIHQHQASVESILEKVSVENKSLNLRINRIFRGYPLIRRKLNKKSQKIYNCPEKQDIISSSEELKDSIYKTSEALDKFENSKIPKFLRCTPLHWLYPLSVSGISLIGHYILKWNYHDHYLPLSICTFVYSLLFIFKYKYKHICLESYYEIEKHRAKSAEMYSICINGREIWRTTQTKIAEEELNKKIKGLNEDLGSQAEENKRTSHGKPERFLEKKKSLLERTQKNKQAKVESNKTRKNEAILKSDQFFEDRKNELLKSRDSLINESKESRNKAWNELKLKWANSTKEVYDFCHKNTLVTNECFFEWNDEFLKNWSAPLEFPNYVNFGTLKIDPTLLANGLPSDTDLSLPKDGTIETPLNLIFPEEGSLLFETDSSGNEQIISSINNIILRLLSVSPPGKLSFSIIDPVGLGQNFARLTHLADYEDSIINKKIWTQREHIETRILELNQHMEKVIQMYLRNEYESITAYNQNAGNISEKYHFLIVADFPTNFSDAAARGLMSIAANGARCGIYTIIHWDKRQQTPESFLQNDMKETSICINESKNDNALQLANGLKKGITLRFDSPPANEKSIEWIKLVGNESSDSNRIEVPFEQIIPNNNNYWQNESSDELTIPIGRAGATKLQNLSFGKGTRQHALLAGKTGSGKSTLLHVVITNIALHFSPSEVEFYLVDFKKGVEFKCYGSKKLPHARVVAIESDREFGLSVLQKLDAELKDRGEAFRKAGAQDIASYKRITNETMPRSLLIIDEFQEFFVEDDKIAQQASVLLDRIVRQGRAFGIHVLLGSQTLGGAYSLARATLGQMVIRIALMCNEADAYLIMDEGNPAPRLLTRPGEGIYNDSAGSVESNSPFQTVWLSEEQRYSYLDQINEINLEKGNRSGNPIVFEGNSPADIMENIELKELINGDLTVSDQAPLIWLGSPNSIKGPTRASFLRQSGNHMMIVGQRDDAILAMLTIAMVTLNKKHLKEDGKIIYIGGEPEGTPEREHIEKTLSLLEKNSDSNYHTELGDIVQYLDHEIKKRTASVNTKSSPLFIIINGLQKFKKLRYDEDLAYSFDSSAKDSNPAMILNEVITEGPALGIHIIVSIDNYNNIGRSLSRKALSEFEMRVLFQMSANDSAALIDSTQAGSIGMHKALFYNEQTGVIETFRPYSLPPMSWIEDISRTNS